MPMERRRPRFSSDPGRRRLSRPQTSADSIDSLKKRASDAPTNPQIPVIAIRIASALSGSGNGKTLPPTGGNFLKDHWQCFGDFPSGIVFLHFAQIAVVTDVIANPVLIDVPPVHLSAGDIGSHAECFQNRAGVGFAAAEIIDLGNTRRLPELIHEAGHILGMNVIAHLLAFVSEDFVLSPFDVALHQIAEESVQLYAGVIRAGKTTAPQTASGHAEIASV